MAGWGSARKNGAIHRSKQEVPRPDARPVFRRAGIFRPQTKGLPQPSGDRGGSAGKHAAADGACTHASGGGMTRVVVDPAYELKNLSPDAVVSRQESTGAGNRT